MDFGFCDTIIGRIGVVGRENFITRVLFDFEIPKVEQHKSPVVSEAINQLLAYFDRRLTKFSIPLLLNGTEFMKKVWSTLLDIPYGKTVSYKDIAIAVGNSKAYRAVGMANRNNSIPIFIPCHRVIKSNGSLGGFSGKIDKKRTLIALEKGNFCS